MTEELEQALRVCPQEIMQGIAQYPKCNRLEEVRIRAGMPLCLVADGKETALAGLTATPEMIQEILNMATEHSVYAAQNTWKSGFLTLPGGHRLGLCGTGVEKGGQLTTLKDISSLNLRIARQIIGCADRAADFLWTHPRSTLLIGPPARGKTTLLRDLIRLLSERFCWRICVVDERMEIAACVGGKPQFRVGTHTDILSAVRKEPGIEMLLRTMNPQWIALDEITAMEDVESVLRASYCGVRLLATAHAANRAELCARPVYRRLLEAEVFENLITILPDREIHAERM